MNRYGGVGETARVLCCLALWALLLQPLVGQTAADLFRPDVLHEVRVQMTTADWATIHDLYLEDTYYPCDVQFDGVMAGRIGMRSRGSQSRSPIKPSIGLDFSRYVSSQRFAGLKTLVMRNLNQDSSMMREFLAEELYARAGLPHSREAFARLG